MWLFTTIGYFSVGMTNSKDYPDLPKHLQNGMIMARGRVKQDFERLVALHDELGLEPKKPKIHELRGHDYEYRVIMPHENWNAISAHLSQQINYSKFKSAVKRDALTEAEGRVRYDLYLEVWRVLYDAENYLAQQVKNYSSRLANRMGYGNRLDFEVERLYRK